MTINSDYEPDNDQPSDWKVRLEPSIPKEISQEKFIELMLDGKIVDGRAGGLLLAKVLEDEPTKLVYRLGTTYMLNGTVSAGSFVLNSEASLRNRNRIKRMNSGLTARETVNEEQEGGVGCFLCTAAFPHNRFLLVDFTQDIVYPEPASHHWNELHRLNTTMNPYLENDVYELFDIKGGTTDGIV